MFYYTILLAVLFICSIGSTTYAFAPLSSNHVGSNSINNRPIIEHISSYTPITHQTSSTTSTTCLQMALLDDAMKTRLDGIRRSYQALTERLADPDVIGDSNLLRQVMKDRSQSEEVVLVYDDYCRLDEELEGAQELFQDAGDDAEMREMARSEMKEIEVQLEELEAKIKILLLPKDPNDDRNCMLEIRAGTGGSEANLFAGDLLDVYRKFMSNEGYSVKMMDSSAGDDGGYKNVVLEVKGDSVYSKLKWEAGVHRVQRVPATETQGRVHTSTATVAIMVSNSICLVCLICSYHLQSLLTL